jgi:hypothetical protein
MEIGAKARRTGRLSKEASRSRQRPSMEIKTAKTIA